MLKPLVFVIPILFSMVIGDLRVLYEWKYIDYLWESSQQKNDAIHGGDYNHTKIFTIDVDRAPDGRIFVSTPRQEGVPAALSTVSGERGSGGPLLKPYPSWSWYYEKEKCRGITSVYRVTIESERLFVLDTGKYGEEQICLPQILIFDLSTDKLIRRILIPLDIASSKNGKGLLITPVVETEHRIFGRDKFKIYMADVEGYGLVVYDGTILKRYNDRSFDAEKENNRFTIAGESFGLDDGIFSLALRPKNHRHEKSRLFYRPLASLKQYSVLTEDISQSKNPGYENLGYEFPSQVSMQAFSRRGILFMGYTNPPAIACWNSYKPMNSSNVNIVARDDETLQFTSGLKIRNEGLWAMTNRYQKIVAGTQNFDEVNFRILHEHNVWNLVKGTTCE